MMKLIKKKDIPSLHYFDMEKIRRIYNELETKMTSYPDLIGFWENIDNFGCKDFLFYTTTFKRGRAITVLLRKMTISCIGGEMMSKEKPQLVFISKDEIPKKRGARQAYDWKGLLATIPEGEAWVLADNDKDFKISTVKDVVKTINKDAGKEIYSAVQRTEDGKTSLYVAKV